MGLFTKDIKTMNDLFVHQLQDIYYAEKQIIKALPKMVEKATERSSSRAFRPISKKPRTMYSASKRCSGCTAPRRRR